MAGRAGDRPAVSVEQMREVDRIITEDLGIGLVRMMENAGRLLDEVVRAKVLCVPHFPSRCSSTP